jgi:hypothetical protein
MRWNRVAGCRCRAARCRFAAIVAASRNDPLARFERVATLARWWGKRVRRPRRGRSPRSGNRLRRLVASHRRIGSTARVMLQY